MEIKKLLIYISSGLNIAVQIIVAAALLFWFTKLTKPQLNLDDRTKESLKINFGKKVDKINYDVNQGWFTYLLPVFLGTLCLILAVIEICLCVIPDLMACANAPLFRGIFYVCIGVITLGVSGDLGIGAGALDLIAGAATIGIGCYTSL